MQAASPKPFKLFAPHTRHHGVSRSSARRCTWRRSSGRGKAGGPCLDARPGGKLKPLVSGFVAPDVGLGVTAAPSTSVELPDGPGLPRQAVTATVTAPWAPAFAQAGSPPARAPCERRVGGTVEPRAGAWSARAGTRPPQRSRARRATASAPRADSRRSPRTRSGRSRRRPRPTRRPQERVAGITGSRCRRPRGREERPAAHRAARSA